MLANPWALLAAVLAFAGAVGGAYIKGRSDGRAVELSERATLEEIARVAREASVQAAAEAIAKISVNHTTIRQKAEVVTREVPVYRDCVNDTRVISLLDGARENRPPTQPTGDRELPGTGASSTPDIR
jgi:hypothetical protein